MIAHPSRDPRRVGLALLATLLTLARSTLGQPIALPPAADTAIQPEPTAASPTIPVTPAIPPTPEPPAPVTAEGLSRDLASAKILEEGDANLKRALRAYEQIIRSYELQRPVAAEAVFRAGEVTRRLGNAAEACDLYRRIAREFSDLADLTARSQNRLVELGEQPGAPAGEGVAENGAGGARGGGGNPFRMSPELMRRYGLMPPPTPAPAAENPVDPNTGQPVAVDPNTGLPAAVDPNSGQPFVIDPTTGQPVTPSSLPGTEPAPGRPDEGESGTPSEPAAGRFSWRYGSPLTPALARRYGLVGSGAGLTPPQPPPPVDESRAEELRSLRSEAVALRTRLRQVEREQRALDSVNLDKDPRTIRTLPFRLIEDPRLERLMGEFDRLEEQALNGGRELSAKENEDLGNRTFEFLADIRQYITDSLRPRLQLTHELLGRELDRLNLEIAERAREK